MVGVFFVYFEEGESEWDSQTRLSKYAKMGEKMFHNIPKNIVVAGRIVRQKVMVTLALDGGNSVENFFFSVPRFGTSLLYICSRNHTKHYTLTLHSTH